MIKRYEIRPRRKRIEGGADEQRSQGPVAGPLTPAGAFEEK
jgi:hypothetical protein